MFSRSHHRLPAESFGSEFRPPPSPMGRRGRTRCGVGRGGSGSSLGKW